MSTIFIFFLLLISSSAAAITETNPILSVILSTQYELALFEIKRQLGLRDIYRDHCLENFDDSAPIAPEGYRACSRSSEVDVTLIDYLYIGNVDAAVPFPDAICGLSGLRELVIRRIPQLYGPIPSCITKLSNLHRIWISETSLSGPVPDFATLSNLKILNLSKNQLSGSVPASLFTSPILSSLDLSDNKLCGEIPQGQQYIAEAFANNECLCGNPLPPC